VEEQKGFVELLTHDLVDAGILVLEEVSKVELEDDIIIVDSPAYQESWRSNTLPTDKQLVKSRLATGKHKGLITINKADRISLHYMDHCTSAYFLDTSHYVINLFDLVLNLYAIPLRHAAFAPLRQTLHSQWEQTREVEWFKASDDKATSNTNQKEIYFSYAWLGESESIVNEIDQAFQKRGVTITRDKRDLSYKGSIKEFMERIGRGKCIVVVISDKYLKSKNCMFELIQIAENKQFNDQIFPVVLSDANIYDAVKRIEYIKYWESKKAELDAAIKSVGSENLQGIREEIDLFDDIRDEIAGLVDLLQDMNTLIPEMHRDSDFQTLYDAVMAKLDE
jgi:hypothetical protein